MVKMSRNMRRIRSDEDRARIARKRGGFDDSYITKENMKKIGKTHRCFHCKKWMTFQYYDKKTGTIKIGCDTDGCPNNVNIKRSEWDRKYKKIYEEHIDRKLIFDMKHLMVGRHPDRLWATRKNTIGLPIKKKPYQFKPPLKRF